ncbi:MAG: hypothetical protein HOO86_00840 [Bacteroidales bacterium]|nr:hypothetical protein [Bacteroidales bacterium]
MRSIALTLFLLLTIQANCQNNNYFQIPGYDCEITSDKKFRSSKEILFVFPNDKDSLTYKEWTKSWINGFKRFGSECEIKYESELNEQDFEKPMLVLGSIYSFRRWNSFETPIKQITKGFRFGDLKFHQFDDAIFYISDTTTKAMRIVITGNSIGSLRPIVNNMRTGYSYLIFEDRIITHFGECTDNNYDKSKHVYLPDLKSKYYQLVQTKYYDFYIAKRLVNQISEYKPKLDSFDLFVDKYIEIMKLHKPTYRIPCFIHLDQEEISYISTHFSHLCGGNTAGVVNGKEIHSKGFGGAIEHETSHLLFNIEYNENTPTFFSEGIRQYYDFVTDSSQLSAGYNTSIEFIDEDIKPVIFGYEPFFQGNKYYYISGFFVKYLIDNWGIDKFKQFYKAENIALGFEQTYEIELDSALINYNGWLKRN